ncbi:MAG TPA: phosphodiester glycosidase family protein [Kofleriaceae bacterium]|nr:phosphodiester glycosidase family protein [Kofleriaceae bacterium]
MRSVAVLCPTLLVLGLVGGMTGPPDSASAATLVATSSPYLGVTHLVFEEPAIPARIHLVLVDLTATELSLSATAESERGKKVSQYSASSGAQIVINGDFFAPADFRPRGLAMGGAAVLWSGSTDDALEGFLGFDRNGNRSHVIISPPEDVVAANQLPVGTQGVIGGRPMLVRAGVAQSGFDCTDTIAMPCERAPRTAVSVSADGNTLHLVVVDGWQQASLGMTAAELAGFMVQQGAHDALMLDGGASSALYIAGEGGIVSSPSDGVERAVANHLGVRFGSLPPGQLVGFIRERDVIEGTNLAGALARLDSGEEIVVGTNGYYAFTMVTPRLACVTASKSGYRTDTRCKQVVSGQMVYNSIPLFPNSDFVDAAPGAPDAAIADAGVIADAPPAGDGAGADGGGGGGGGCNAAGTTPPWGTLLLLFLLTGLTRRRPVRTPHRADDARFPH